MKDLLTNTLLGMLLGLLVPIVIALAAYTVFGMFSFFYFVIVQDWTYAAIFFPSYLLVGIYITLSGGL